MIGGYINSPKKTELSCGIETLGGHIFTTFPTSKRRALPFAKCLMMAISRESSTTKLDLENGPKPQQFDGTDFRALPLLNGEVPLETIKGDDGYLPCCYGPPECCINMCCYELFGPFYWCGLFRPFYCCSAKCIGKPCFPWLPYILTLCIRPFYGRHDIIITEKSVITYMNERNYGICGCCGELCPDTCDGEVGCNVTKFSVAWALLDRVQGHTI